MPPRIDEPLEGLAEREFTARVTDIQDRHHALLQRAAKAATDMLDVIVAAKKAGAGDADLKTAAGLDRKAQWRLDFEAAENSMGFHAPQEMARILGETIGLARQGQLEAERAARKGGGRWQPSSRWSLRIGQAPWPGSAVSWAMPGSISRRSRG